MIDFDKYAFEIENYSILNMPGWLFIIYCCRMNFSEGMIDMLWSIREDYKEEEKLINYF